MRYASLLLLLLVFPAGAQRAYSQRYPELLCPTISVECRDSDVDSTLSFSAKVNGGNASKGMTLSWTVSAGKITSGQGTTSITVDKTGFAGQAFTATVEVGGVPRECPNKASCSTPPWCPPPIARKFDQYGDLSWAEERARLDKFAGPLEPSTKSTKALQNRRARHRSNKTRLVR
jgi:hypothetical protein